MVSSFLIYFLAVPYRIKLTLNPEPLTFRHRRCGHRSLRSIRQVFGRFDFQPARIEGRLSCREVVSLKPNDERKREPGFLCRGDDALAMTLQSMMPPKMLTRIPFTSGLRG